MYYDYYNNDNIIISSVCITIMKTLKLGGKMIFLMSIKSHHSCPDDIKPLAEFSLPINEIHLCTA